MCRIVAANLLPADLNELIKQKDTFMQGDTRRITLRWVGDLCQFLIIQENDKNRKPEVVEVEKKLEAGAFIINIEPQSFCIGNNDVGFSPDNKEADKRKMKLAETMCKMIEERRSL